MSHFAVTVREADFALATRAPQLHFHGFLARPSRTRDTDRELVIDAYHRRGAELQGSLSGEFCTAIIDGASRRLVLTHDGLGLRPAYYAVAGDAVHVGSRVGDVALRANARELDEEFMLSYLRHGVHPEGRTAYAGVRRVPPGHTLVWNGTTTRLLRTWDLDRVEPIRYSRDEDYDEQFLGLLRDAIRSRAGGSTWAELSGGLDSSSIVSVAAHDRIAELDTVSFVYSRSSTADERRWITPVLDRYRVPWHPVDADSHDPFSALPDPPLGQPSRAIVMWGPVSALQRTVAAGDADVLLSGFGGDQVLAGDVRVPPHLADLLLAGRPVALLSELRRWQRADRVRRPLRYYLFRYALQPANRHLRRRAPDDGEPVPPAPWLSRSVAERPSAAGTDDPTGHRAGAGASFYRDQMLAVANAVPELWNGFIDQFDIRYPLLDRSLVEFMAGVPWPQKLQPGGDRVLQRRALHDILPAETRARTDKRGPDEAILRGYIAHPEIRERLTRDPLIVQRGFVDGDAWRAAVDAARFGRLRSLHLFLSAASLEIWLRRESSRPGGVR